MGQDAGPYKLAYEQKGGVGRFEERFLRSLYRLLRREDFVDAALTEPLTKSEKFRSPSVRREDWAVFNGFEEIKR